MNHISKHMGFWMVLVFLLVSSCNGSATETPPTVEIGEITFFADQTNIPPGECTQLHWDSRSGFGVYLDEQPVDQSGDREICPSESHIYILTVDVGTHMESRVVEIHINTEAVSELDTPNQTLEPGIPAYQFESWIYLGGPLGGLGYDIRMDPRNPDVMYVTDAYSGVFKSTDGGLTWFAINNGIIPFGATSDVLPIFSLTIDPNNPDILWAGSQHTSQIYRSVDAGESWVPMNTGTNGITENSLSIRGITVEPDNSNVVYIGGEVPSSEWNGVPITGHGLDMTRGVIYRTTDGGQTWTRLWDGDNLCRYIWINPENHNIIYASTGIFDREAANSNAATNDPGGVGILRSLNGGTSWEILGTAQGFDSEDLYFGSLFMHPENPRILIAASGNDTYSSALEHRLGGIYLTEDGGDSWVETLDGHHFSSVEVCMSDPSIVYASARSGFFRSEDGGHSWAQFGENLWGPADVVVGWPIDIQCDPRDPLRLFVNAYGGGVFLSEDGGETWVSSSQGYTGALMFEIGMVSSDADHIYVSARSGIFSSIDGGQTWQGLNSGLSRDLEGSALAIDPGDPNHILVTFSDSASIPRVTFDSGQTWSEVFIGITIPGEDPVSEIHHIQFNPDDPYLVLAALTPGKCHQDADNQTCTTSDGSGIILSHDGGLTWQTTSLSTGHIMDTAFSGNGQQIFAVLFDGGVYISENDGETWRLVNYPNTAIRDSTSPDRGSLIPRSIAVDPNNSNNLFVGFQGGGVAVSRDGGETWTSSSSGMLPEASVVTIVIDPSNPNVIYAGAINAGVYFSVDEGQTWTAINSGLLSRHVRQLAISENGSVLYMASEGGGVFRLGTP